MKSSGIALCFVAFLLFANASNATAAQWAFRVSFTDKNGSPDINNPLVFLSQRALDRRAAHGIAVDNSDLPVSPVYLSEVLSLTNGVLHVTSRWLNDCVILLSDSSRIGMIQGKPYISSIKYIAFYATGLHNKPAPGQNPNKKFTLEQATAGPSAKGTGQPSFYNLTWNQTSMVNGDCMHDQGYKGQGKLIAVLDEGFSETNTHPGFDSLRQSGRLLETYDFVRKNSNVYNYSLHGTQVLSAISGYVPGTFIGSAPLADIAIYITEDVQSEQPIEMDNMVAAAEHADSLGADIITSSLGYNIFDDFHSADLSYSDLDGVSTIADQGANWAVKKGILFVITAGNEGGNQWNHILTPGDADSALTVGAVDPSKNIAGFSGFGPNFAGVTKPDVCLQGDPAQVFTTGGSYLASNGTSFATPQLAGWAACLLQAHPSAMPYQLREAIVTNGDHYSNPGVQYGYGVPNVCQASNTLTQIVNVAPIQKPSAAWINVYPTYFHTATELNIVTNTSGDQTALFTLTGIDGRLYTSAEKTIRAGEQHSILTIPSSLPAGVYIFRAVAGNVDNTVRLVKY